MAKTFSFADLNKEMRKFSEYGDTLDKSTISEIDHYIPTGNFMLNMCLTGSLFKGYPNNRAVALAGPSGTGKTFLTLNAVKQAQAIGYDIIYFDSENAVDRELVEKFGIDVKRFRYEPCNTVQEFRTSVTAVTDVLIEQQKKNVELPKILIVLDSAGNLATQKEVNDAKTGSDKADMTRAKLLKSTFRILMTKLGICKIPLLLTNHTYMTQDLFSKQVGGGGCLAPGSLILMSDGKYKEIENILDGDQVKTLLGDKEVTHTWTFDKPTFQIEFEDGSILTCSEDHRFFIGGFSNDPLDDNNWVYAKDLNENEYVSKYTGVELKKLKIKKVTELRSTKVHDLTIDDAQHYITNNGVINHNTGPEYAASIILFLGKSKLKDKEEGDGKEQTGIIVAARPNKNRFAKPKMIKFHISFSKGMNPYVGLEEYISWDSCKIGRGKFLTVKEHSKLTPAAAAECHEHRWEESGETKTLYFQPKDTSRSLCVGHLNDMVPINAMFTDKVITRDVLEMLEPIIAKDFNYGTDELNQEDFTAMLEDGDEDDQ